MEGTADGDVEWSPDSRYLAFNWEPEHGCNIHVELYDTVNDIALPFDLSPEHPWKDSRGVDFKDLWFDGRFKLLPDGIAIEALGNQCILDQGKLALSGTEAKIKSIDVEGYGTVRREVLEFDFETMSNGRENPEPLIGPSMIE